MIRTALLVTAAAALVALPALPAVAGGPTSKPRGVPVASMTTTTEDLPRVVESVLPTQGVGYDPYVPPTPETTTTTTTEAPAEPTPSAP